MLGGEASAGLLNVDAQVMRAMPVNGADRGEEAGHLVRVIEQLPVQVPRIPVQQDPANVEHDRVYPSCIYPSRVYLGRIYPTRVYLGCVCSDSVHLATRHRPNLTRAGQEPPEVTWLDPVLDEGAPADLSPLEPDVLDPDVPELEPDWAELEPDLAAPDLAAPELLPDELLWPPAVPVDTDDCACAAPGSA
jgi:hypothetical protein